MTRALLCALLLSSAASAVEADAELEGNPAASTIKGLPHYRVGKGSSLSLKLTGPAAMRFEVRREGTAAKPITAAVELDGKPLTAGVVELGLDDAKSDRGQALSKTSSIAALVPKGKHTVKLRWPADASGDALVALSGVKLAPATLLALPGLEAAPSAKNDPPPLPLPVAAEKKGGKSAPLDLPLAKTAAPASPPVASAATPPAAAKPPVTTVSAQPAAGAKPAASTAPAGQAASGARPVATAMAMPVDRPLVLRGPELWEVTALAGGERSSEDYSPSTSHTHLALQATRAFSDLWMLNAEFGWRSSAQQYSVAQPGSTGGTSTTVDENRFDLSAGVGYDFGPRLLRDGRLQVMPVLGVKYLGIRNRAFPADLFGVQLGGRVGYALSSAVIAQTEFGYAYNLSVSSSRSALGAPTGDFTVRAGLKLPLAGGYALSLNYQGDILAFNNVYRVAHGAAVGFGYSF